MGVPRESVESRGNAKGSKGNFPFPGIQPISKLRNPVKLGWKKKISLHDLRRKMQASDAESHSSSRLPADDGISTPTQSPPRSASTTRWLLACESDSCDSLTSWPRTLYAQTHPPTGGWCSCTVRNPDPRTRDILVFFRPNFTKFGNLKFGQIPEKGKFSLNPPAFLLVSTDLLETQKEPLVLSYLSAYERTFCGKQRKVI